ncbi:protein of unknown function [Methylacidimicrobium sp. AP8]|uniref:DUF302 domain-containing protein n=1 Tax=Methylacidimicrobium sp. AP8 TaxID=2730359 RepID=UPI0018C165A4|nr:DUF302 domain-containing protein [Methylacidimicrobium sp. AP8]CAB4243986.1 protein of unknown function [Methylacidimicrobium sp. AP8]
MKTSHGFGKEVATSFEETVPKVVEALRKEGFGILCEIDVAATLRSKLGKEMPPYRIEVSSILRTGALGVRKENSK